ncbi:serine hydrolase domain-containing protein, partial [Mycobacterium marinum]
PVSKYRPDVPNGDNITIEQLLNMRSGLYNYSETPEVNEALDNDPQRVWTPDELLTIAYQNPPYFLPGAGYHYSNTNYVLLGLIA